MTDIVNPSIGADAESFKLSRTVSKAAASTGYIAPNSDVTEIAKQDGSITESNFNEFAETHSASSFDVDIDAGESFVFGSYVGRDTSTTVTISSSSTETIYLGWDKSSGNNAIIDTATGFSSDDSKIPLYDVTTDGSGVTSVSDRRTIGQTIDPKSVETEEGSIGTTPDNYHVVHDGTDITAKPQVEPPNVTLEEVTGTDIGTVLSEIIVNQLPPQGSKKEATGTIKLGWGEFPGQLSGNVLPSQCWIEGQAMSNWEDGTQTSAQPTQYPPTQLNFDSNGAFQSPNVDSDVATHCGLAKMTLKGPGRTSATGLLGTNSNIWDWFFLEEVNVQKCKNPLHLKQFGTDGPALIEDCKFREFDGSVEIGNNHRIRGGTINASDPGYVVVAGGLIRDTLLSATGETNDAIQIRGKGRVRGCRCRKLGGSNGSGKMLVVKDEGAAIENTAVKSEGWNVFISVASSTKGRIIGNNDDTTNTNFSWFVDSACEKVVVSGNQVDNSVTDDGTLTRRDGETSGTYDGNGGTSNDIKIGFSPTVVLIEGSDGTLYEARDDGMSPINGSNPSTGAIRFVDRGFQVDDGGSDADPNTANETYTFRAIA